MYNISVLGLGYIGLPTAITLANAGFNVNGFDISNDVVETLSSGKLHIIEPGLAPELEAAIASTRLNFSTTLQSADVYYIAVPTPFYFENGNHMADLSYVYNAAKMIAKVLKKGNLVILESTVPPKTTEKLAGILEENSNLSAPDFYVAHCPERIIPGKMLYELKNNDRIIGGICKDSSKMASEIYYKVLENGKCHITDALTAEMCKLVENTFRDINIAYANELSIICDSLNINVFELIRLANCHPRVNILSPGVGVGGHCIAVDPWFIYQQFPEQAKLIHSARMVNDYKPRYIAEKVCQTVDKRSKIAILGLAYKPDVDDLRESASIELLNILNDKGFEVIVCEPYVAQKNINGFRNLSIQDAISECQYAIVAVAHSVFRESKDIIKSKPYYDCVGLFMS